MLTITHYNLARLIDSTIGYNKNCFVGSVPGQSTGTCVQDGWRDGDQDLST